MQAVDEVEVRRWGLLDIVIAVAVVVIMKEQCPVLLRRLSLFPSNCEHDHHVGKWPVQPHCARVSRSVQDHIEHDDRLSAFRIFQYDSRIFWAEEASPFPPHCGDLKDSGKRYLSACPGNSVVVQVLPALII